MLRKRAQSYSLKLTRDEYKILTWLAKGGYDASILHLATVDYSCEDISVSIPPRAARRIHQSFEAYPDRFLKCCYDATLAAKLVNLLVEIQREYRLA